MHMLDGSWVRRATLAAGCWLLFSAGGVGAQEPTEPSSADVPDAGVPEERPSTEPQAPATGEAQEEEGEDEESEGGEELRLQPPSLEPPSVDIEPPGEVAGAGGEEGSSQPSQGESPEASSERADEGAVAEALLDQAAPEEVKERAELEESAGALSALGAALGVSGYLRLRAEWWRDLDLGRQTPPGVAADHPFDAFRPLDSEALPRGGCAGDPSTDAGRATPCPRSGALTFGSMRLRLRPVFSLGESVRVHTEFDVFDNAVLGSGLRPGALGSLDPGLVPLAAGRDWARDAIRVRRAYGEVVHRELGRLRFGRMGWRWGLGMLYDEGEDLDADRQTDVDRIEGTRRFGHYWVRGAWDFAWQGAVRHVGGSSEGLPLDASTRDDIDRFVLSVERRFTQEEAEEALRKGRWVLEGGLQFAWWSQTLSAEGVDPGAPRGEDLVRRDAQVYQPDLWFRARWGGLRLALEAAAVLGSVGNVSPGAFEPDPHDLMQLGLAFEGEYRTMEDKLAFHLGVVAASGDPDVDGLSEQDDLVRQQSDDRTISTFRLHPNYRVDEILWRRILGRVAGALVVKPGISYDLVRSPFGGLFGGRFDVVYSRALSEVQTYGSDPDLGLELDFSAYYRSEDGTTEEDGFHLRAQYALLFPFAGLGYPTYRGRTPFPSSVGGAPDLTTASIFRVLLGISF